MTKCAVLLQSKKMSVIGYMGVAYRGREKLRNSSSNGISNVMVLNLSSKVFILLLYYTNFLIIITKMKANINPVPHIVVNTSLILTKI